MLVEAAGTVSRRHGTFSVRSGLGPESPFLATTSAAARSGEQEARDVGRGDQHEEPDGAQQHQER